jgi:hypothetical protein
MKLEQYEPFIPEAYRMSFSQYNKLSFIPDSKRVDRANYRDFITRCIKYDILYHMTKISTGVTIVKTQLSAPTMSGSVSKFFCLVCDLLEILNKYRHIIDPDRAAIDKLYEDRLMEQLKAQRESRSNMRKNTLYSGKGVNNETGEDEGEGEGDDDDAGAGNADKEHDDEMEYGDEMDDYDDDDGDGNINNDEDGDI